MYGGSGNDLLEGGTGDNVMAGGMGQDTIRMGVGDDIYTDALQAGGFGCDTITGGDGINTFVFGPILSQDVITDFERGEDRLELDAALVPGDNAIALVEAA